MMNRFLQRIAAVITVYLGVMSVGFNQTSSQEVVCSVGWFFNGSSCYYVYNDTAQKLSFFHARQWCQQNSSDLTSVLNQEENDFLDYLVNKTHLGPNETFYIGLRRIQNQDRWEWVGNKPYNYTNWFHGQEPQPLVKKDSRICAFYNRKHQWEMEETCGTKRLFICKQQQPTGQENVQTPTPRIITSSSTIISNSSSTEPHPVQTGSNKLNELNELLSSLEGATFDDSSAEKNMKELGAVLDSVLDSAKSQSVADLAKVVEMSEKIGKLIVSGLKRGGNITDPKNIQIKTNSLSLGVNILPPVSSENNAESVTFPQDNKQMNTINLPASLIWKAQHSDGVSITNLLLPNVSASEDPQAKRVLNSGIISSTILFNNGSKFNNLSEPVVIKLSAANKVNAKNPKMCAFMNTTTDPPSWSSSGCVVHYSNASYTECHCYHMTSYAVLMDVHGAYESDAISEKDKLVLSTLSIVGCLIAFVCYIVLLCTFFFLRKRTETSSIHMNLAAAELFAIFFFLVAYPAVGIKEACFAVAVLLYYFQLASFCWMLVEGINLLRGMVKVFRVTSRLRSYCLFAWGFPAIVVTGTAIIFRHQFLREKFCWLSHELIWAFAGPVAFIVVVNLIILAVAIKIVVRRARYKVKPKENRTVSSLQLELRAAFKTTVILMPLLGVTWLLGFISIHDQSLVFQYLFAIINSMQGVYFLIAQYCFDDDIKRNAHHASIRMKRLFSLSSTKSSRSSSDRKSGTYSDRKNGLAMRPNLVSPQQSTDKVNREAFSPACSPTMSLDKRYKDDTLCSPQQGTEDQQTKKKNVVSPQPSIADQDDNEDNFIYPQLDGEDQRNKNDLVIPEPSIADEDENKTSLCQHLPNNDETSIGPQQSPADRDKSGKESGSAQQIPADQRDNLENCVSPTTQSNEVEQSNEDNLVFKNTANEDKNKAENFVSPPEEIQDKQVYEVMASSHQNDRDQSKQINEENFLSPQLINQCTDQLEARNNSNDTRF